MTIWGKIVYAVHRRYAKLNENKCEGYFSLGDQNGRWSIIYNGSNHDSGDQESQKAVCIALHEYGRSDFK